MVWRGGDVRRRGPSLHAHIYQRRRRPIRRHVSSITCPILTSSVLKSDCDEEVAAGAHGASRLAHPSRSSSSPSLSGQAPLSGQDGRVVEACVICLQPVTERAITVPCNHYIFDFICIASWLNERSTCPLCNEEVTQVQYDWRAPHDYKTYKVQSTKQEQGHDNPRDASSALSERGAGRSWRRRAHPGALPRSLPTEADAVLRRRQIYRRELYSLHVGSNRISRYREFTPQAFTADAELQSRARRWIRRELQVFRYLNPTSSSASPSSSTSRPRATNAEFLLEYIIAILKSVDIKDSDGRAEDLLQEFLGRGDARLFLHELSAWLRSPYTSLHDWDTHVQYAESLSEAVANGGGHAGEGRRGRTEK